MPNHFDRRSVILAGSALAASAALSTASAQTGLAPAADLLAATRRLLGSLEPDQIGRASCRERVY